VTAPAMTEPERRRAAGETPFADRSADTSIARVLLHDVTNCNWDIIGTNLSPFAHEMLGALLRAIVAQALVDRIVAWCTGEVTP